MAENTNEIAKRVAEKLISDAVGILFDGDERMREQWRERWTAIVHEELELAIKRSRPIRQMPSGKSVG